MALGSIPNVWYHFLLTFYYYISIMFFTAVAEPRYRTAVVIEEKEIPPFSTDLGPVIIKVKIGLGWSISGPGQLPPPCKERRRRIPITRNQKSSFS
jgi:hypothetical protein